MECVRCVATLELKELYWEDPSGTPIHLAGPPVFLRVCVLGQLQHTQLFRPTFPLNFHSNQLTFDRILTNCSDPALLRETITGEHVYVEIIQVSDDYKGGKILARYEAPAEKFLFPEPPLKPGQLRRLTLSKSRNYKYSPQLTLTASTTVTKLTISTSQYSPSTLVPGQTREQDKILLRPLQLSQKVGVATQDKLRLLLDSYAEPHRDQEPGGLKQEPHRKILSKSPNTKFSSLLPESEGGQNLLLGNRKFKVKHTLTSTPTNCYECCTAHVGPHNWTTCPRRTIQKHSRGQNTTHPRSKSTPSHYIRGLKFNSEGPSNQIHDLPKGNQRPFVAGKVDPRLLSQRDFCGQQCQVSGWRKVKKHGGDIGGHGLMRMRAELGRTTGLCGTSQWAVGGEVSESSQRGTLFSCDKKKERTERHFTTPPPAVVTTKTTPTNMAERQDENRASDSQCTFESCDMSCDIHSSSSSDTFSGHVTEEEEMEEVSSKTVDSARQRCNLLSKYLNSENGRMGMGHPARLIENKLQTLINDCCECKHSIESLGEDDMSEDNDRLRESLLAEREEQMNKSAKLIPDNSMVVSLGKEREGGRDYWSQRVAEFQGKHHRLVFDETIEKIYCRLYQRATNMN